MNSSKKLERTGLRIYTLSALVLMATSLLMIVPISLAAASSDRPFAVHTTQIGGDVYKYVIIDGVKTSLQGGPYQLKLVQLGSELPLITGDVSDQGK